MPSGDNTQRKMLYVSVIMICYVVWIIVEQAALAAPLFNLSREHIKMYRTFLHKYPIADKLTSLLSEFGDKGGLGIYLAVSSTFQNQAHAFMTALQICVIPAFSQTVKSILREPRPLMVDRDIPYINDCKHMEFGNPSAHTLGCSLVTMSLVYTMHRHYAYRLKIGNPKTNNLILLGSANVALLLTYAVGFSRVFKGVHTYNQIISGLVQGSLLALIQIVLYEDIFKFFMNLKYMSFMEMLFNPLTSVLAVMFAFGYWVHLDTMNSYQLPDKFRENIVAHCGELGAIDPETANFKKMYLFLSYISVVFGSWFE